MVRILTWAKQPIFCLNIFKVDPTHNKRYEFSMLPTQPVFSLNLLYRNLCRFVLYINRWICTATLKGFFSIWITQSLPKNLLNINVQNISHDHFKASVNLIRISHLLKKDVSIKFKTKSVNLITLIVNIAILRFPPGAYWKK